ncbi:MAG: ferredoxin-thioredoxin reductase catalytic domain-containing protein [Nitrososphaeria archaeon]
MITLQQVRRRSENDAAAHGYYLNPDTLFLNDLLEGLRKNEERYGYPSCPCRVASGNFELDRDIICPCDYRDIDVKEYGGCYCALYVSKEVYEGRKRIASIPERRPIQKQNRAYEGDSENKAHIETPSTTSKMQIQRRLWYCKQCGYMCFREEPPYICPICKAKKDFFSEIKIATDALG